MIKKYYILSGLIALSSTIYGDPIVSSKSEPNFKYTSKDLYSYIDSLPKSNSMPNLLIRTKSPDFAAKTDFFSGNDFGNDNQLRGIASLRNGAAFAVLLNDPTFTYGIDSKKISSRRMSTGDELIADCPSLNDPNTKNLIEAFHKNLRNEITNKNFGKFIRNSDYKYIRGISLVNDSPMIQDLSKKLSHDEHLVRNREKIEAEVSKIILDLSSELKRGEYIIDFEEKCREAAKDDGGVFLAGKFIAKNNNSIQDKVLRSAQYWKSANDVLRFVYGFDDLLRGTILVHNYKEMATVMDKLYDKFSGTQFDIKYDTAPYTGYVGVHAYIPVKLGDKLQIIAEVQMHTIFETKIGTKTHVAYEVARNADEKSQAKEIGYFADAILYLDAMISGLELNRDQATTFARQTRKRVLAEQEKKQQVLEKRKRWHIQKEKNQK